MGHGHSRVKSHWDSQNSLPNSSTAPDTFEVRCHQWIRHSALRSRNVLHSGFFITLVFYLLNTSGSGSRYFISRLPDSPVAVPARFGERKYRSEARMIFFQPTPQGPDLVRVHRTRDYLCRVENKIYGCFLLWDFVWIP